MSRTPAASGEVIQGDLVLTMEDLGCGGCDTLCHARRLTTESPKGSVTDTEPRRPPIVVLVGTLDTKGREYGFLADRIREQDADVLVVDAGILGEPLIEHDVTRQEVAAAAGADVQALADARDRPRPSRRWAAVQQQLYVGSTPRADSTPSVRSAVPAARPLPRARCGRFQSVCRS